MTPNETSGQLSGLCQHVWTNENAKERILESVQML